MASGGVRLGSGKKSKSLEKKILEGKSAKFIPMNDFSDIKCDVPKADKFLKQKPADGGEFDAETIYTKTYKWLHSVGCDKLVPDGLIRRYSWMCARYEYCESRIMSDGEVVECEANGGKMLNPYQKYSDMYHKQMTSLWTMIFQIVRENASEDFNNNPGDGMEKILREQKANET